MPPKQRQWAAQIEEVSDSESDSDPSEMDPAEYDPSLVIQPRAAPTSTSSNPAPPSSSSELTSQQVSEALKPVHRQGMSAAAAAHREKIKRWICLYPVYFDARRSKAEGRRVGKSLASENPLAREIADAVSTLGLQVAMEPGKMHPKDWANPGRVKVMLKGEGGEMMSAKVNNKHHLYILVAKYLQAHPPNEETPLRLPIAGLPKQKFYAPAVPRGWKMGSILPLHSPAVSGGGVSENMFKDMMSEMSQLQQGQGQGQVAAGGR